MQQNNSNNINNQFHKKKLVVENGKEHDLQCSPKRMPSTATQVQGYINKHPLKMKPSPNPPNYWESGSPAAAAKRTREVCDELYWAAIESGEDQIVAATSNARALSASTSKRRPTSAATTTTSSSAITSQKNLHLLQHVTSTSTLPLSGGAVSSTVRNSACDMVKLALRGRAQWEHAQQEKNHNKMMVERRNSSFERKRAQSIASAGLGISAASSRPGTAASSRNLMNLNRPTSAISTSTSVGATSSFGFSPSPQQNNNNRARRPLSASAATIESFKRRALSPSNNNNGVVLSASIKSSRPNTAGGNNRITTSSPNASLNISQMSGNSSNGLGGGGSGGGGMSVIDKSTAVARMGNGQMLYQGPDRLFTLTPHRDRWREFDKNFNGPIVSSREIAEFERRIHQTKKFKEMLERMKAQQQQQQQQQQN